MRLALLVALPACLVQEVDLRTPADPLAEPPVCGERERLVDGRCVHCDTLDPPETVCPCAWRSEPADLPFCATTDAYYRCLPCTGDIRSCRTYDVVDDTSSDCSLLKRCCQELAGDAVSTACCPAPEVLHCALEPGAPAALVGCLDSDCCQPPCHPTDEVCEVVASQGELTCYCRPADTP